MAKQDDYIRISLRLPPELHKDLVARTGARSLNADIVDRLEKSVEYDKACEMMAMESDRQDPPMPLMRDVRAKQIESIVKKFVDAVIEKLSEEGAKKGTS